MKEPTALCCGNDATAWQPLNRQQRWARLIVGVALLAATLALPWSGIGWITVAIITAWVGGTYVLAAATRYPGCPELGALPSLCIGRWVKIGCGPWRWLDAKLRLKVG